MHLSPPITTADVRLVFLGVTSRKAMGPDRVPGHALRSYADLLPVVFTDIFNLALLQAKVPSCFKKTTIIPDTYIRLLVIDYSSAFNTIICSRPISKFGDLGCILSPLLYSLYTYDCVAKFQMNVIYKFADNTTVQTKELNIDFRKKGEEHEPIYINGAEFER
eukprot:g45523.t1